MVMLICAKEEPPMMDLGVVEESDGSKSDVAVLHPTESRAVLHPTESRAQIKTLWNEIDMAREMFEGKHGLEFCPEETTTKSFVDLFQMLVSRVVHFIVSEQINHEIVAKALLGSMIKVDFAQSMAYVSEEVDKLVASYKHLEQYASNMTNDLATVAVQADQKLGTSFFALLKREVEATSKASAFIVVLNDIYEAIRAVTKNEQVGSSTKWVAPATFERSTTKYWIERGRMTDLLLVVVGEAPLLVYGESGRLTSDHDLKRSEGDKLWNSLASSISSVYFDSPSMCLYKKRIVREEGSQLLRIRWYGGKPKGDDLVFLELKTHHEKWNNIYSVKQRVSIREKDVNPFLSHTKWEFGDAEIVVRAANPELKGDHLEKAIDLILTMHKLVLKHDLRPCVGTKYQRVAFQSPESNKLRLTVDRNITLIDETSTPPGEWCLADSDIKDNVVIQVPYNVFEVKLAGSEAPESIESLLRQDIIEEAPKFSKFLTGAAAFNPTKVNLLPYWAEHKAFALLFTKDNSTTSRDKSDLTMVLPNIEPDHSGSTDDQSGFTSISTSSGAKSNFNGATRSCTFGTLRHRREKQPTIAFKRPARVEPKSYFANERTFIQWISAAVLVTTIAVLLLKIETQHPYCWGVGLALLGTSAVTVVYSVYVYVRRVKLLSRGEPYGYVDHCGPLFLSCAIFLGLLALIAIFVTIKLDKTTQYSSFTIQPKDNVCVQHEMAGLSRLEYQPSDILVQENDDRLMIASLDTIRAHSATGNVETLVEIPGADLEALTSKGRAVYAVSEVSGKKSKLFALVWNTTNQLEVFWQWEIETPKAEGIAYVPGNPDKLYISGDLIEEVGDKVAARGVIDVYDLPTIGRPLKRFRLNSNMINDGLTDSKISSLEYFENVLYVLHDNAKVVRAWALNGALLSEWKLPPVSKQWEGLAFERRNNGQLRGSGNLLLNLSLDSPPQVWTLAVQEGEKPGEIILPDCAMP